MQSPIRLIHNFRMLRAHGSPPWSWHAHLVGLCGGTSHRRNVGPIGRDFPTSFSFRTFREALEQAHLSRTDHSRHNSNNGISRNSSWRSRRRLRWTWWIFCARWYVAGSELNRISQLMRDRTWWNGSFIRAPRHCHWYVE